MTAQTSYNNHYQLDKKNNQFILHLQEKLDSSNAAAVWKSLRQELKQKHGLFMTVDAGMLSDLDDYGVATLVQIKKQVQDANGKFTLINAGKEILETLQFYNFETVTSRDSITSQKRFPGLVSRLGQGTVDHVEDFTFMMTFLGSSCFSALQVIKNPKILRWQDTILTMQKTGADALPIVGLISFLLGLIMAFMSSVQLQQFGANVYVASLVSLAMTRELGPIMTAIIVAGRSGSSYAAEIGSMKISEEVDALFTMGFDPHLFLVMPKIVAALLVVPLLTLFSDLFAILGGLVVGVSMLDLTINGYITQTINTLDLFDVFWGVFKSGIFALLISWVGCLRGFQVKGGASGVGQATTSAVVSSIFLIILADSVFSVILRYWE